MDLHAEQGAALHGELVLMVLDRFYAVTEIRSSSGDIRIRTRTS